MKLLRDLSIGKKLVGSFIIIIAIQALQSYFASNSLSNMNDDITQIVTINQPASIQATRLNSLLRDASRALGFYIITAEEEDLRLYNESNDKLSASLEKLQQLPAIQNNKTYQEKLAAISNAIKRTQIVEKQLITISQDPNQNMPAMSFSAENINPQYRTRLQLLSSMLVAEEDEDADEERKELTNAIVALRYYWTTINNELRLFLAFRTAVAVDNAKTYRDAAKSKHAELMELEDLFTLEQDDAMQQFNDGLEAYWSNIDKLFQIHQGEDWRSDAYMLRTRVAPALQKIDNQISELVAALENTSQQAAAQAGESFETQNTNMAITLAVVIIILGLLAWILARSIGRPIKQAVNIASQIAGGNLNNSITIDANDETGKMLSTLDHMQTDLRKRIEADAKVAAENLRIKDALDNVSVGVTVSNNENVLIYMNQEGETLLKTLEPGIRSKHPDFSVTNLLGKKLSNYFEDADVRSAYQRELKQQESYNTVIGDRNLTLIASPVYDSQGNYQGRVTQWEDITEALLAEEEERQRIEAERKIAAENARIRSALDNVSSNVMLADNERHIIYMNKNVTKLFTDAEQNIRKQLPNFDPSKLLGANIDGFHVDPSHQAAMLERLSDTYESELSIGGMTMKIIANPVFSDDGERLGTAVEWSDRTLEVAVEKEIDELVDAARNGNLSRRIDLTGKQGFFKQLGEGFNDLLGELSNVFHDIASVMSNMAEGDLSRQIEKNYNGTFGEVKDDINKTIGNLSGVLADLMKSSHDVSDTSNEISDGNSSLSSRTEQQSAALEETAASMEELTSTVKHNADNAQQANQVASTARNSAEKGGEVVSRAVTAMNEINDSSNKIAEIIGVIDEIAFQTNLLALNASVEAARAGEQGRGFAVVATEVRNLASRSAEAAREIKELIQDSLSKVKSGTELVDQSGSTLEEIVGDVKKVGDIVAEIAASSNQQAAGIDEVNQAVTAMDELTQQNAALAEQTSAASASMSDKAEEMLKLAGFFKIDGSTTTRSAVSSISRQPASTVSRPASHTVPKPVSKPPAPKAAPKVAPRPAPASASTAAPATSQDNYDEWEEF